MDLRVAVLVQGEPRFCQEFDLFLENLVGYDRVDWFFYIWKTSPPTSTFAKNEYELVSERWQNIDQEWALNKFKENLPPNHTVAALELADQNLVDIPSITENITHGVNVCNVWKMWHSQYHANQLRVNYEKEHNIKYDIVIRTRPDVALLDIINVRIVAEHFKKYPNLIIIPKNRLVGEHPNRVICDLIGIGSPENMTTYTDLYNRALEYHNSGVNFHPENLLAHHLTHNDLIFHLADFNIEMRWIGYWQHTITGEVLPISRIKNPEEYSYFSHFGRWE